MAIKATAGPAWQQQGFLGPVQRDSGDITQSETSPVLTSEASSTTPMALSSINGAFWRPGDHPFCPAKGGRCGTQLQTASLVSALKFGSH
eukprot:1043435-Amphidinium_carterae.1